MSAGQPSRRPLTATFKRILIAAAAAVAALAGPAAALQGGPERPADNFPTVATAAALANEPAAVGAVRWLSDDSRHGIFKFGRGNFSAQVAADRYQGLYVAPASAPSGASGAWVRQFHGPVFLSWFGVADGAAMNAARVESAIALLGSREYMLPVGQIHFDRDVYIRKAITLRGHGMSSRMVGTRIHFPAGSSGFRTAWDHVDGSSQDPYDAKFVDFAVHQPTRNTNTATGHYTAATRTFAITGGTNDFANGQVVWIEGAGPTHRMIGKTGQIAAGSNVINVTSEGGNPGVHPGMHIGMAGLPAGTTVVGMTSTTITVSHKATRAAPAGSAITVRYPLVARIVSGGGTANLILDTVFQDFDAAGVVIKHADSGFLADRPVQIENVGSHGFPIGANLAGDLQNVPTNVTNTSAVRFSRLSGRLAAIYFGGRDGNASTVMGNDFSFSESYGVLDLSLIGNFYAFNHFAFNVGIASPLPSSLSKLMLNYFEQGTSYIGNGIGTEAFGNQGTREGSGWLVSGSGRSLD